MQAGVGLFGQRLSALKGAGGVEQARLVGSLDAYEVEGSDGVAYQVEVEALWDDRGAGTILVLAEIDDGTLRGAFRPVTDSFLMGPDGTVRMARDAIG